jgi:Fe-S-cluster-containing dehydrogenase component
MKLTRRELLGVAAGITAATTLPRRARAADYGPRVPDDDVGMLYDSTLCIGCKACMAACKRANDLPPEHSIEPRVWDDPVDLSGKTETIIKLVDDTPTFTKAQCMHCVHPACVSVCILGAMHVGEHGIVSYDASRCIGCRYCQIACPYNVPKFEWDEPIPTIKKCELCRERPGGPACCEVCPRGAIKYGKRNALLAEARSRLAVRPDDYNGHIYGEFEGGGTHVLYIAKSPFEDLGLPELSDRPVAELSETIQHGLYRGFIAPAILYCALATVMWRNRGDDEEPEP